MRVLKCIDNKFGCFQVKYVCRECGKVLFVKGFSWDADKVSMTEKEKITQIMDNLAKKGDINFCVKCGAKTEGAE